MRANRAAALALRTLDDNARDQDIGEQFKLAMNGAIARKQCDGRAKAKRPAAPPLRYDRPPMLT